MYVLEQAAKAFVVGLHFAMSIFVFAFVASHLLAVLCVWENWHLFHKKDKWQ